MQVQVQKFTRTTWPRSSAVAPPSEGMCTWANTVHLAKRPEARADLFREQLRLLPGRKVPALVDLVVVDEIGIGLLRPTLRHLIELVRGREDLFFGWEFDAAAKKLPDDVIAYYVRGLSDPDSLRASFWIIASGTPWD